MLQTVVNGLNKYLRKGNSLHICHCIYALLIYTSRPRFTSSNTVLICSHLFWSSTYAKALKNVKFTNEPEKKKNICSLICRDCEQDCTFLSDYNLEQKVCSIATTWSYQSDIRVPASRYVSDLWSPFGSHTFFPGFASSRPTITHFPTSEWLNVTTLCAPLTSQRTHTCINTHSTWILVFFILHWNAFYKRLIQVTLTINYKNFHNDSALTKYYS